MRQVRVALGWAVMVAAVMVAPLAAQDEPLDADATLTATAAGDHVLRVAFTIAPKHILYADRISVAASAPQAASLVPRDVPAPKEKFDEFEARVVPVYDHSVTFVYNVEGMAQGETLEVTVRYQGCSETVCFMPQEETFSLSATDPGGTVPPAETGTAAQEIAPTEGTEGSWTQLADRFQVSARKVGFMDVPEFKAFLRAGLSGEQEQEPLLQRVFRGWGLWAAVLLILPLGLLLNLTPCVLPMIPVNLAIIGAGSQAQSRKRGFLLGTVFGSGMAVGYGALGIVAVLTRSRFGALNSSPWFNLAVTVVFIILGLAAFDVIVVDLSRFQTSDVGTENRRRAPFITAFLLGGMAALLAGACVAPVLISVLLLSMELYSGGSVIGLFLPFILGAGMALPWPFAGAGLSFLPKPGGWMNKVKIVFGVLIFLAALYFGKQTVVLFADRFGASEENPVQADRTEQVYSSLPRGLEAALEQGKPVFVDFWALSCKVCMKMKKTTLAEPDVVRELQDFVIIEFQADDLNDPVVDAVLKRYNVFGLPTFLVLTPK